MSAFVTSRDAAGRLAANLRAAAATDATQEAVEASAQEAVHRAADELRAALDDAGEVCGRTFSPFPPSH